MASGFWPDAHPQPARRHTLKTLTRNLLVAASLLLTGGLSTTADAQSQTPAASDAAPAQQQSRAHASRSSQPART